MNFYNYLPFDIVRTHIFPHLSYHDLTNLGKSNKYFYHLCKNSETWRTLIRARSGLKYLEKRPDRVYQLDLDLAPELIPLLLEISSKWSRNSWFVEEDLRLIVFVDPSNSMKQITFMSTGLRKIMNIRFFDDKFLMDTREVWMNVEYARLSDPNFIHFIISLLKQMPTAEDLEKTRNLFGITGTTFLDDQREYLGGMM